MAPPPPARLLGVREPRDDRRHDHRGPPPVRGPVGRSLRGGLGRGRRRALRARSLVLGRLGAAGGVQRGPLRAARGALGGRSRRGRPAPARRRRVEHPDHVPYRPAARRPRHAAGRVPARDRELLGSGGGGARARAADEGVPLEGRLRGGRGRAVKVVAAFPRPVRRIEHCWIPLPDGCRLAARVWLPEDAETSPVPAIVEYIPYRKRDFTRARDEPMHHYFAGHGYAAVRVDVRGSGESDGVLLDEYAEQELADGVAVIDWLAARPWCTGAVGMIGKSWGGINVLEIAARRPPALRAIITVCGSDDRYADDAHYMGGCLLNENLTWGSMLLTLSALPPDPALVGERWRALWLARLEHAVLFPEVWLRHQRRDAYWRRADLERITSAVYALRGGGGADTKTVPPLPPGPPPPPEGPIRALGPG